MGTLYQNGQQLFNVAPLKNTYSNDPNSAASAKTVYDLKEDVSPVLEAENGTIPILFSGTQNGTVDWYRQGRMLSISIQNAGSGVAASTTTTVTLPYNVAYQDHTLMNGGAVSGEFWISSNNILNIRKVTTAAGFGGTVFMII